MTRYYISGSNGRIGSTICGLLRMQGHEIEPITRAHLHLKSDLGFKQNVKENRILLHLAWPVDGIDYRNSLENQEFLEVSKRFLARYADSFDKVLVSGSIFEMPKDKNELHDDTSVEPRCRYSESKVMLHDWIMQNRINYSWPIIPYVVSAKDPEFKLIPTILRAVKKPELTMPLKYPKIERNFIHVRECASIIVACLNKDVVGRYLIGSETDITPADLVEEFKLNWESVETEYEEKEIKQKLVFLKVYRASRGKKVTNHERASQLRDLILEELRT